ncbi:helix-turn-helix domain-containing protein [Streptomyces sp. LARHCF249]
MPTEEELFDAVDALLAGEPEMPPPAERARLREAAGITQARLAQALQTTTQSIKNWEAGRSEPRPPRRQAYQRLLDGWIAQYGAQSQATPATFTGAAAGSSPQEPAARIEPAAPAATKPTVSSRRPGAKKAVAKPAPASAAVDPRFENGPLAVLDVENGQVVAYCVGGLVLDVPAKSLPSLVDWTLTHSKLGAPRLHPLGKDSDPLIVLTAAAAVRYGLPEKLSDEERLAGRLPEGHKICKQLAKADWQLTQRGFGPWARIYRPAESGQRRCVQLCIVPWDALDVRDWGDKDKGLLPATLPPGELARVLGTFASRVLTSWGLARFLGDQDEERESATGGGEV